MNWHTGLKRLRLVGTVALAVGVVLCASVIATRSLGYSPDLSVAPLFAAMWPCGLALIILGALLWIAVWILQGFIPAPGRRIEPAKPASRDE